MTHDRPDPSTPPETAPEGGAPPPPRPPQGSPDGAPAGGTDDERDARLWATLCHLSGFVGFLAPLVGNIVAPLLIWLLLRERWPLVDDQGKEALNFQISVSIYAVGAILLTVVLIGFPLLVALAIFEFVLVVIAAIRANEGERYRYPLTLRLVQ